ncbi:MAG: thioesterase family protein [Planctomycetota bacterium]|nr:thioesterase family protein [Planctomycetota bacterium]
MNRRDRRQKMNQEQNQPEIESYVHRLRVRYGETDRMGVAHHSSYVMWFEETRTEWMRAIGLSYRAMEDGGLRLPVVRVDISYHRPVTYEDEVEIDTSVVARRRVAFTLRHRITRADDGSPVATGEITLACVDANGRPRQLPAALQGSARLIPGGPNPVPGNSDAPTA